MDISQGVETATKIIQTHGGWGGRIQKGIWKDNRETSLNWIVKKEGTIGSTKKLGDCKIKEDLKPAMDRNVATKCPTIKKRTLSHKRGGVRYHSREE